VLKDYSVFFMSGVPRAGQDLEEVADLMRAQVELIKKGEFDDWMVEAVINDFKLSELRGSENNWARAGKMVDAFIEEREWSDMVSDFDKMDQLTKQDIVDFANTWFGENYVQVNKRNGESNAVKVEKPVITPVNIDRESQSPFYLAWDTIESGRLEPVFLDYDQAINQDKFNKNIDFYSIVNESNELFSLYYILDMGTDNDKELGLAIEYLPYLGTKDMSAEDLQKELFKLGVSFDVFSSRNRSYVVLSGLNSSLEAGVKLFENVLSNVEPDAEALTNMVDGILKKRQDAMKNKGQILNNAMLQYAQYGPNTPFKNQLSEAELRALKADALTAKIKEITSYKHSIFYYGPMDAKAAKSTLEKYHVVPDELKDYPAPTIFTELPTEENKVYFVDFDMVQSEMLLVSKGPQFNAEYLAGAGLFNQYFGSGLSSIVFQEIRESKALAYSAYSVFTSPARQDQSHYVRAYIGAQVDKLPEAADAMLDLMNNLPKADIQFESARDAALKQIETDRVTRASVFWNYMAAKDRGLDYDIRKSNYEAIQKMTFDDLQGFFDANIKGKNYVYNVIGNAEMVDKEVLEKLGPVEFLTLEELFGYPEEEKPTELVKK
jgi:predicted Zn-dependent peptidase